MRQNNNNSNTSSNHFLKTGHKWSKLSSVKKALFMLVGLCAMYGLISLSTCISNSATSDKEILSLTVSKVTDSTVSLAWNGINGVQGYNIYRSTTLGWRFDDKQDTWIQDYSKYVKLNANMVDGLSFTDKTVQKDSTYYYVVTTTRQGIEGEKENPVAVKPPSLEYDAALACYGGYTWSSVLNDAESEKLIDGDESSFMMPVAVDNSSLNSDKTYRGFQKVMFGSRVQVSRIEIVQRGGYLQATKIRIVTDDGTQLKYNLTKDINEKWNAKSVSTLTVNKKTSSLGVYIDDLNNSQYGPYWYRISAYTNEKPEIGLVSPGKVAKTDALIDFSKKDGAQSGKFGLTEIQTHISRPRGWELTVWPYWNSLKSGMHRITLGDEWPHNYGTDRVQVGKLTKPLTSSATTVFVDNSSQLAKDDIIRLDDEYMKISAKSGNTLTVTRGFEGTLVVDHAENAPVYEYYSVGYIRRATELLTEYPRVKCGEILASNIDVNKTVGTDTVFKASGQGFKVGDVVQINQEVMRVDGVNDKMLTVTRGYDGTDYAVHWAGSNIFKMLDYKPVYNRMLENPNTASNYDWHYWDQIFDKIVLEEKATPWVVAAAPSYMFNSRGYVSGVSADKMSDNTKAWWTKSDGTGRQFSGGMLYILTGAAAGKRFYVKDHTENSLLLVTSKKDQTAVDLSAQGVRQGDAYKVVPAPGLSNALEAPAKERWQDYLDFWYEISRHLTSKYPGSEFYFEFWNEPDLFGYWTDQAYIELFKEFGNTIRTGGKNHYRGFSSKQIKVGAGSLASGFKNGFNYVGINYKFIEELIAKSKYINFVTQHRYGIGDRKDKRALSWEASFVSRLGSRYGKNIEIIDSENSPLKSGNGNADQRVTHESSIEVPYWGNAFINYFYGDQGAEGRHSAMIQYRMFTYDEKSFGLFMNGEASPGYWAFKLFADNSSRQGSDTFAKVVQPGDQYGWVRTMAITQRNGQKKVFIVNKKDTPIALNLQLVGVRDIKDLEISRVNGNGQHRTVQDGYQPFSTGGIVTESLDTEELSSLVLEPNSFNVLSFN